MEATMGQLSDATGSISSKLGMIREKVAQAMVRKAKLSANNLFEKRAVELVVPGKVKVAPMKLSPTPMILAKYLRNNSNSRT